MEMTSELTINRIKRSRIDEVDFERLEFGKYVSDHMLVSDFDEGEWKQPVIAPYGDLTMSPATLALHYGQTVFEGMKAFRMQDGRVNIFRIDKHYQRFARSLDRLCMPVPSFQLFSEGIQKLIEIDRAWVPKQAGASLYLRPFMYASEEKFGVKISGQYKFVVFSGPVPDIFAKPISVKVETEFIRAARGGTGFAKCGGNYGGAYYPTKLAKEQGYDQLLWTNGNENPTIEESGMMNVMFVIDNMLVTPPLSDSILDGVTRDSLLTIAKDMGYKTLERSISVKELATAFRNNTITEAFGAGTAAVVAPIQTIGIEGVNHHLPAYNDKSLHQLLKQQLNGIRTGAELDQHEWNCII